LRAGVGIHTTRADLDCSGGEVQAFQRTSPAWLLGGGIDVFRITAARLRLSAAGSYRRLVHEFWQAEAPEIEPCRNTLETLLLNVDDRSDRYRFDMSGWQAGLVLWIEP